MKAIVWSMESCPYCMYAKNLLQQKGYEIEEKLVKGKFAKQGEFSKEQLLEAVPGARTVPQIFLDGQCIGGYDDLKKHFQEKDKT